MTQHHIPVPPRYRWGKRLAWLVLAGFLLLVGLRLWWGAVARGRLDREITLRQAADEPVYLRDFASDAGGHPGASLLIDAAAAISLTGEQSVLLASLRFDWNAVAGRLAEVRPIIEANQQALALARRARAAPDAPWLFTPTAPGAPPVSTLLGGQVQLNQLISLAAAFHHFSGDDVQAVEFMHDHCAQAAIIARSPFLLSEAMPGGLRPYALGALEVVTPRLMVERRDGPDERPQHFVAADRARVKALIALLMEDEPLRESLRSYIYHRRAELLEFAEVPDSGAALPGPRATVQPFPFSRPATMLALAPMLQLDGLHLFRYCTAVAEASAAPDWQTYRRQCPTGPPDAQGPLEQVARPISNRVAPSFARSVRAFFRALASRRMAATALAMRLYELDHGARPDSLEALNPEYLPRPPIDPFTEGDQLIRYLPEGDTPILYSVGPDGRDDGGEFGSSERAVPGQESGDIPFYLNGNRPSRRRQPPVAPPVSTQAGQDDQNVQDSQRQGEQEQPGQARP